jgi:glycopeptide antibiotics resistance protein
MRASNLVILSLAGWSALFLAAGLWPYRFRYPDHFVIYFTPMPINGVLNFICFLPFGFLFSRMSFAVSPIVAATLYCFLLSLAVEAAQLFLPGRYASVSDVILNTLGGAVGATLFARLAN